MSMDFSEVNKLAYDLSQIPGIVTSEVRKSVQQTAMETKKSWQADAKRGGTTSRRYAAAIDYDIEGVGSGNRGGEITADVGPNIARYGGKTGKGGLLPGMGIIDDPQSGVRGRPSRARRRAEKFAADELEKRIQIAVDRSLGVNDL